MGRKYSRAEQKIVGALLQASVTPLDLAIFRILEQSPKPLPATRLNRQLGVQYGHMLTGGSLYTTLHRMEEAGELRRVELLLRAREHPLEIVAYKLTDYVRKKILPRFRYS